MTLSRQKITIHRTAVSPQWKRQPLKATSGRTKITMVSRMQTNKVWTTYP